MHKSFSGRGFAPRRLPLIRIILPYPQTKFLRSRIFRTSWRSQDTNKITVIYQYAFRGNTVLHFIITHILCSKFMRRIGKVMFKHLQLKMVCTDSQIPCYGYERLYCRALPFVVPAPEVLAEIKAKIF